ncbi:nuclear envelope integral membrane protein 1 isoform X4 [Nothoprocta perdicaria]|uniref:nuclear envelope integral membrane protein 1 isoform X4 n=1 Tax=Nothoprocta perdicaria TaxID=30464 RepID=UPI000E1BC641|nr:nuclear envelope integral membrane protein 1 isoform X4 [Nothoprocta perdicaria]
MPLFLREEGREPVIPLQEGRPLSLATSHHFCYTNTRRPQWHDVWTRIQEKLNDTRLDVDLYSSKTCLKVELLETGTTYHVLLSRCFDPMLFLVFFLGLVLFFCGDVLSRSQLFFYSTGITFGLLASLLILIYVVAKVMPRRSPVYFLLVGGWSFSLYLLQLVFKNLREICSSYWQYLLGYLLVAGAVSFGACYRLGPPRDRRTVALLSWGLQLLGLLLLYGGIQVRPVGLAAVLGALCAKNLEYPLSWARAACRRAQGPARPPGAPRLLTAEQYRAQGEAETRRALEELRRHCRSAGFSAWATVSRIRAPKRFADFVGGAPHLTPNEVSVHEREYGLGSVFLEEQLFEDEDDDEEEEDEEEEEFSRRHPGSFPLSCNPMDTD